MIWQAYSFISKGSTVIRVLTSSVIILKDVR